MANVLGLPSCLGASAALWPGSSELRKSVNFCSAPARRRGSSLAVNARTARPPIQLFKKGTPEYERLKTAKREGGTEYYKEYREEFKPAEKRADNVLVLDFEKPLIALEKKIEEVKKAAELSGLNVDDQVQHLQERADELRMETYTRLTAPQKLQVARHPQRPTFLDIMLNISDNFIELRGDRAGYDDPAIVCGYAFIDGEPFMCIGQQKGRNTKENVFRNFGMPQPNGYRKALRYMNQANKFGIPIFTFIDTPGAFAGKTAEDLGQGEAIAVNLREMFGIEVPIITTVLGEGGSGGALAIGCANHRFMMQNSVFFVASPEACASILWKDRSKVNLAATVLRITAPELLEQGIMDEIIPEPLGGSHNNPPAVYPMIKEALMSIWNNKYKSMLPDEIMQERFNNYRVLGMWTEYKTMGLRYHEEKLRRDTSEGCYTPAGTWAVDEEERDLIIRDVDAEEDFVELLEANPEFEQYLNVPVQPPGLLETGLLEVGAAVLELRLRYKLDEARVAITERRIAQLEQQFLEELAEREAEQAQREKEEAGGNEVVDAAPEAKGGEAPGA